MSIVNLKSGNGMTLPKMFASQEENRALRQFLKPLPLQSSQLKAGCFALSF